MNTAATTADARPTIRRITADDVYAALAAGWADFRAAPRFGLFFGGVYALLGIAIFLQLWVLDQPFWIVPFAFAFPLIGPFAAIGLYEVSRRREAGEPLDWAEVLGVVWTQAQQPDPVHGVHRARGLHDLDVGGEHPRHPLPRADELRDLFRPRRHPRQRQRLGADHRRLAASAG